MLYMFVLAMVVALAVDHFVGEPRVRWHPVVWMGNALERFSCWALPSQPLPHATDWKAFGRGTLVWIALTAIILITSLVVQWVALLMPVWLAAVLLGFALKPMLAWRMLRTEVQAVEAALQESLAAGRERLGWLVSRDVTQLTESQVRESAIESLAENLHDSVVAPLFWFLLLGLPGAALYRFSNTADAMWGYKGVYKGRNWEWAGKWAAYADDVLSWVPARLTALVLVVASGRLVLGRFGLGVLRREARRTPSPNSGWPMAAMALGLDVCLQKPGVYALNRAGRAPLAADTTSALRLAMLGLSWFVVTVCMVQIAILFAASYPALWLWLGGAV